MRNTRINKYCTWKKDQPIQKKYSSSKIIKLKKLTPHFHTRVTSTRNVSLTQIRHIWNPWRVEVTDCCWGDVLKWRIVVEVTCWSDGFVSKWRIKVTGVWKWGASKLRVPRVKFQKLLCIPKMGIKSKLWTRSVQKCVLEIIWGQI